MMLGGTWPAGRLLMMTFAGCALTFVRPLTSFAPHDHGVVPLRAGKRPPPQVTARFGARGAAALPPRLHAPLPSTLLLPCVLLPCTLLPCTLLLADSCFDCATR